MFSCQKEVKR